MSKKTSEADALKKALKRADTSLLLYAVALFQASAMLLLTLRTDPIDGQSLLLAAAMPAVTILCVKGLSRFWKIDRVVLTLVLFLCSVGVVTLTAVARTLGKRYGKLVPKIGEYLKTVNLYQYRGSTYDTTLDEEASRIQTQIDLVIAGEEMTEDIDVSPEQIRTWGSGFDPLFYRELDQRYDYWTEDLDFDKVDKATETLIRQICIQEVILSRDAAAGRPIDKTAKMIDSLLGSLNLKPVQKPQKTVVEDAMDEETEMTPFGVWIRKIEDDRPIPEAEEQFADVDHLKDYLQTWFVGGLCNMMHIPNAFSDKFEEAMQKYTVEKPEYHADDDDISLDDLFEKAEEEGRKVRSNGGTSGPSDEDEDY